MVKNQDVLRCYIDYYNNGLITQEMLENVFKDFLMNYFDYRIDSYINKNYYKNCKEFLYAR